MNFFQKSRYCLTTSLFTITTSHLKSFTVCRTISTKVQVLKLNSYCYRDYKMNYSTKTRPKVYVTRPDYAKEGIDLLKTECDVTTWTETTNVPRDELLKNIVGKDALFCSLNDKIDKGILDAVGENLKVIATISVGYDHIDVNECKKRGIRLGYTPNELTDASADLTIALLLATARRLIEANKEVYNGGWTTWSPSWMCGKGIKNSVVGIYGLGRIGLEVAKRCIPFKPKRLIYHKRTESEEGKKIGAEFVTFDELLKESDFIIVNAALTPETKLIFNKDAFDKMKNDVIFINTARGAHVDQNALYNALKEKRIYAAGLDVTTPEPLPLDDPLLKLNNVVILPHIGSADINTRIEMSKTTALNILKALKNEKMISEI